MKAAGAQTTCVAWTDTSTTYTAGTLNWNTDLMHTAVTGTSGPVVGTGSLVSDYVPNLGAIILAFATGECGSENLGGVSGPAFAAANIQSLVSAGVDYVVSTGGQAGTFTCSSNSGMQTFLSRYMSADMAGVDFDIEGGQTQTEMDNLVAESVYAQSLYPNLRFSFTLAALAASDGSYGGVNSLGNMVIRAVKNLEHTYGIPASKIEVTPMIGVNDVSNEVFTAGDVDAVVSYAVSNGLAGVHFWSLDHDTPLLGHHRLADVRLDIHPHGSGVHGPVPERPGQMREVVSL